MNDKNDQQRRVGAWVRQRRRQLGLSQGDVRKRLGYQAQASVSNIEQGRTAVPTKRAYAWAEVLGVDRSAFFEFVTGLRTTITAAPPQPREDGERLTRAEVALLARYRALPRELQERLRGYAAELAAGVRRRRKP
jgi:transcriptional regulator with XRE-family HTH domain